MTTQPAYPARDELWRDGHVLVRGLMPRDELGPHRVTIGNAVRRLSTETRELESRDTYGKAFLQITNLWEKDESVRPFVFEKRLAQVAADLLGVEKVRLYHDQALFKEPGGGHTPWHQDKFYWPLDTEKMVTMWMPLVDVDAEMGMVRFASGSHVAGPAERVEISDDSDERFQSYIESKRFRIEGPETMRAGDATFHLGWTIHSAAANRSRTLREVMTIIYFADGARLTDPESAFQKADLETWFPGQTPGEIAASELNPVMN